MFSFYELDRYDVSNISFIFIRFVTAQNFGNLHEIQFFSSQARSSLVCVLLVLLTVGNWKAES